MTRADGSWPADRGEHVPLDPAGGASLLALLSEPQRWVHRRTETTRFLDDQTIRRHVCVDFEAPEGLPYPDTPLVPLALLRKEPLTGFDLRDEAGNALPMLTSAQNGRAAAALLLSAAEAILGGAVPARTARLVRRIAALEAPQAFDALDRLGQDAGGARLLRDLWFEELAFSLAENFILLVPIVEAGRRRLFKFAYDETLYWPTDWPTRVGGTMGWRSMRFAFEVPAAGEAGSYHFELLAPSGLEIGSVAFVAGERRDETRGARRKAHVYVAGAPRSPATVAVRLRPSTRGLVRQGFLSAAATTVLLGVVFSMRERIQDTQVEAATALLLVVPASLSLFIARPEEHDLASRLLLGVRLTLVCLAALPYAAAFVLLFEPDAVLRTWWLAGLLALGTGCTLSLGAGFLNSRGAD